MRDIVSISLILVGYSILQLQLTKFLMVFETKKYPELYDNKIH